MKQIRTLRNILSRKLIGIPILAAAMAASGLLLAAPPASAAGLSVICETNGSFCIGAPSLHESAPVKETGAGRIIDVQTLGGNSYLLTINANPNWCVAGSDTGDHAVLHPCQNGSGVVWKAHLGPDGKSCVFESQKFSGKYLSGDNKGDQFQLRNKGATGTFQQFKTAHKVISSCG